MCSRRVVVSRSVVGPRERKIGRKEKERKVERRSKRKEER